MIIIPKVLVVMKPVDGGQSMIGVIECPQCGETHYTARIECGERSIFCGTNAELDNGYSTVDVTAII